MKFFLPHFQPRPGNVQGGEIALQPQARAERETLGQPDGNPSFEILPSGHLGLQFRIRQASRPAGAALRFRDERSRGPELGIFFPGQPHGGIRSQDKLGGGAGRREGQQGAYPQQRVWHQECGWGER